MWNLALWRTRGDDMGDGQTALHDATQPDERMPAVIGRVMMPKLPKAGAASTSSDRLVAALVVMIQQANRNRRPDADTLVPLRRRTTA